MTKDGQPNVYALGTSTVTFEGTRAPNGITWPSLSSFGGWTIRLTKAMKYADGRTQFFALDSEGRLIARSHQTVDRQVSPWWPIGFSNLTEEVVALPSGNGFEVLVHTSDGVVASSQFANERLTNVRYVTTTAGRITDRPAAVVKNDGKVQIFARRADGRSTRCATPHPASSRREPRSTVVTAVASPAAVIKEA